MYHIHSDSWNHDIEDYTGSYHNCGFVVRVWTVFSSLIHSDLLGYCVIIGLLPSHKKVCWDFFKLYFVLPRNLYQLKSISFSFYLFNWKARKIPYWLIKIKSSISLDYSIFLKIKSSISRDYSIFYKINFTILNKLFNILMII